MNSDIRICFVGDSFINGTGDENALGWAGRLCVIAAKKNISTTYYNLGIRRNTSQDILLRIKTELSCRLPVEVDSRIVISFGVNDTAIEDGKTRVSEQQSISNFNHIIKIINPAYQILMVGPPPINNDAQNKRIKSLNNRIHIRAKTLGIPFIDIFSKLESDKEYKKEITDNDGAHPKSKGYEKLANIIGSSEEWWF
ncbi:MAG: GDSL-type esterase/lipase family protein [Pseudomonadota bacterium]